MRSADENNEIIFAEYVFMMRGGALSRFLPGEWQERAADMRKLRDAFNTADVDGNNELELEELEMVIIAMNPRRIYRLMISRGCGQRLIQRASHG